MTLLVIAYLGGALTIVSPCILPILPFVFARAEQPFLRGTLPMLIGMAATFALVATLAAVGGSWAINANEYGRLAALFLLVIFGISLISPRVASFITQPAVDFGNRLLNASGKTGAAPTAAGALVLGVATGLLWAPCAGPILGLVLTGAALQGANLQTTLLLLAYAAGAATSLAVALCVGGKVLAGLKKSLGVSERVRQGLGGAVLAGVARVHDQAVGAAVDLRGADFDEFAQFGVEPGLIDISLQRSRRLVGRRIDLGHVDSLLHERSPLLVAPSAKNALEKSRDSGGALTIA